MATLRKQLLLSKIENAITENSFVLFFQHNNIKQKKWVLLKNLITNLQHTNLLVCKNALTNKTVNIEKILDESKQFLETARLQAKQSECANHTNTEYPISRAAPLLENHQHQSNLPKQVIFPAQHTDSQYQPTNKTAKQHNTGGEFYVSCQRSSNRHKTTATSMPTQPDQKLMRFFCQGPTVIITTNSINSFTTICNVLNVTRKAACFTTDIKSYDIVNTFQKYASVKLPDIFKNKKQYIDSVNKNFVNTNKSKLAYIGSKKKIQYKIPTTSEGFAIDKINSINKSGSYLKNLLFFVGGLAQNQLIDHLDLKKLCKLDQSIYRKLVTTLYIPIKSVIILPTIVQIYFLDYFTVKHDLFYILHKKIHMLQK